MRGDHDNVLALTDFTGHCERHRLPWHISHDPSRHDPDSRYELHLHAGPAHGIYTGRTATHAATRAMTVIYDHLTDDTDPDTYPRTRTAFEKGLLDGRHLPGPGSRRPRTSDSSNDN